MPQRTKRRRRQGKTTKNGNNPSRKTRSWLLSGTISREVMAAVAAAVVLAVLGWLTGAATFVSNLIRPEAPITIVEQPLPPPIVEPPSATAGATPQETSAKPNIRASSGLITPDMATASVAPSLGDHFWVSDRCRIERGVIVQANPEDIDPLKGGSKASNEAIADWFKKYKPADSGVTYAAFVIQAKPGKTVSLVGAYIDYVERASLDRTTLVSVAKRCIGFVTPQVVRNFNLEVDLNHSGARLVPGAREKTNFPYKVSDDDPEVFVVTARTSTCYCVWRIAIHWTSDGKTGVSYVDNYGRNFRTAAKQSESRLVFP